MVSEAKVTISLSNVPGALREAFREVAGLERARIVALLEHERDMNPDDAAVVNRIIGLIDDGIQR